MFIVVTVYWIVVDSYYSVQINIAGHYVVVCGYDKKKKRIFYKNPSYDEGKRIPNFFVYEIKFFPSITLLRL